jgi:hypothetical protein
MKMATELVAALGIDNVHFKQVDGRQYDLAGLISSMWQIM